MSQQTLSQRFLLLSSITLAGAFIVNLLNYFFTLVTGRLLAPELFSEIATLIGFLLLVSVPAAALTLYVAKETVSLNTDGNRRSVRSFFEKSTRKAMYASVIGLAIFAAFIPFLSAYLGIGETRLLLFSLLIPANFLMAVNQGIYQGEKNFTIFSYINIFMAALKFFLAIVAIKLGGGVDGVIAALIAATILPYIWSYIKLSKKFGIEKIDMITPEKPGEYSFKSFFLGYSQIFWATLFLALLLNMDVILAKHYLSALDAGYYAALSIMGKIIIYAGLAFVNVMFPMVSGVESYENKSVLKIALAVASAMALIVIGVIEISPEFFVGVLFGNAYLSIAEYVWYVGFAMFFLLLCNVLVNYFIAIKKGNVVYPLGVGALIQALILIYGQHTLLGISRGLLYGEIIILAMLVGFYFANVGKNKLIET